LNGRGNFFEENFGGRLRKTPKKLREKNGGAELAVLSPPILGGVDREGYPKEGEGRGGRVSLAGLEGMLL
jgi:hypothetical protein